MTMFPTDDVDPPAMLRVYVPDHTVNSSVLVFSKMTVDALEDRDLGQSALEQEKRATIIKHSN